MSENSKNSFRAPEFTRVYCEESLIGTRDAVRILSRLKNPEVIPIPHYKDVFCRAHQNYSAQSNSKALILAKNTGEKIYKGAPVCQGFGEENFCYSNSVLGCVFDCDYCFLKGVFDSADMVVFVNFDDYKAACEDRLEKGPMYLCVSYDTDLPALNSLTGLADKWIAYAKDREGLTIEIRTKSAPTKFTASAHIVYSFTLSPESVIENTEHKTPPLSARLASVRKAVDAGARVRLCIDPIMLTADWENEYTNLVSEIASAVDLSKIRDVSVGTFRLSAEYLKRMRKNCPLSPVAWYPYTNVDGVYQYAEDLDLKMQKVVTDELKKYIDEGQIWRWNPEKQ